jgi:hypothetical protein
MSNDRIQKQGLNMKATEKHARGKDTGRGEGRRKSCGMTEPDRWSGMPAT